MAEKSRLPERLTLTELMELVGGTRQAIDRHVDFRIGQRGTAKARQIDGSHTMFDGAERISNSSRRIQLSAMPLPIVDRQAMTGVAFAACNRERRRRIETTGKQDDRGLHLSRFTPVNAQTD